MLCKQTHIRFAAGKGHRQGKRSKWGRGAGGCRCHWEGVAVWPWDGDAGSWNCLFEVLPNDSRCVLKTAEFRV